MSFNVKTVNNCIFCVFQDTFKYNMETARHRHFPFQILQIKASPAVKTAVLLSHLQVVLHLYSSPCFAPLWRQYHYILR